MKTVIEEVRTGVVRRALLTNDAEIRELKRKADNLKSHLDDPDIKKRHGEHTIEAFDSQDGFNMVFPAIEDVEGSLWGKGYQLDSIAEFYGSKTGKKHMDI